MTNGLYTQSFICFGDTHWLLTAALPEVTLALKQTVTGGAAGLLLVLDSTIGHSVDLDIRSSRKDLLARLVSTGKWQPVEEAAPYGCGWPKLGVMVREVTLLLRH